MTDRHLNSPYPIRPSPELRAKLENAAREGGRSLHAEIIMRLEASFSDGAMRAPSAMNPDLRELIKEELELFLSPEGLRQLLENANIDVSKLKLR